MKAKSKRSLSTLIWGPCLLALFLGVLVTEAQSLELDEKLPLRILKTSRSKKTVLINRGLEDGLIVGNHAKFFLTKGVIARGLVMKASPTRSVWALYRIIDAQEIVPDKVMNLKISTPVKVTEDPSKMLGHEDIPQYNRGRIRYYNKSTIPYYQGRVAPIYKGEAVPAYVYRGVPVAKGGNDLEYEELKALEETGTPRKDWQSEVKYRELDDVSVSQISEAKEKDMWQSPVRNIDNDWEFFGVLNLNTLSSNTSNPGSEADFSGSFSSFDTALGVEKYFPTSKSFWRNMSFGLLIHRAVQSTSDAGGGAVDSTIMGYGLLATYYFRDPFIVKRLNWMLSLQIGLGTTDDESLDETSVEGGDFSGSNSFYSFGGGAKWLFSDSWGAKGVIDYYQRTEEFEFDTSDDITRIVSGPRATVGLFYRF